MKSTVLKKCSLFDGIGEEELGTLINCLSARVKCYDKNEYIFTAGDKVESVGVIMEGSVHVIKEDFWGNRTILTKLESGDLFAESFSCAKVEELPVSVLAVENSEILLIDYKRVITSCSNACVFHSLLIENMIKILAGKNLMLMRKMEHTSQRTTRDKLLSYLSEQAQKAGDNSFFIPFNRQELADYLSVERSAMSTALAKMQGEGVISFKKNHFILKK